MYNTAYVCEYTVPTNAGRHQLALVLLRVDYVPPVGGRSEARH